MKADPINNEEHSKILENLVQREKQERIATVTLTTESLTRLNVTIDALPQKCQQLLLEVSERQAAVCLDALDPLALSLLQTKQIEQQLADEYQLLELRQKNQQLQRKIDENKKVLESLRRELESSKESLQKQNPNPDNIQEHLRQMKQKLASYEEIYEKAKVKYIKLSVPDAVLPKSLEELSSRLTALREQELDLKQRADDVTLARQARDTLSKLRR